MKNSFIFLFAILFSASAFGQSTEYSMQLGSGFFSFRGPDAAASTYYIMNTTTSGYASNPYGRGSAFSYGIALQVQRVTKKHFIYGLQAGYESLSSRIKFNNVFPLGYNPSSMAVYPSNPLEGSANKSVLTNQYITMHPFIGGRLNVIKKIYTDLTFGTDLAFCASSEEHDIAKTGQVNYDSQIDREKPHLDSRLRIDLNNYYKHFGLTLGYSYGLTNYEAGTIYGGKVYSQMIRLGLIFKL